MRRFLELSAVIAVLAGCDASIPGKRPYSTQQIALGNAETGRTLMKAYGCGACHDIPGVAAMGGRVGPPLGGFAHRRYIAGVLPNTGDNLVRWLIDPPAHDAKTAMPDMAVPREHAVHMAAYFYDGAASGGGR